MTAAVCLCYVFNYLQIISYEVICGDEIISVVIVQLC